MKNKVQGWYFIPFLLEIFFTIVFMFIFNGILNICYGNVKELFWPNYWTFHMWGITSIVSLFLLIIYIRLKQIFNWKYH